ncbi:MAG: hypothetical protein EXR92_03265 [Gemmatimonadetes bacterium]|nr:hypothetical protein [Gemmatimonadota bacterium]
MVHVLVVVLVLISAPFLPEGLTAQQAGAVAGAPEASDLGFQLGSNYPNPFNPDTRIPFDLSESAFVEGRPVNVTIRIYDILRQYVASPTALSHPAGDGTPVIELEYTAPGRYEAYWDGRNRSGLFVRFGVYILELTVNGRSQNRRIFAGG